MTTDRNNKGYIKGGFLDVISFDPISNKYFNELTEQEKSRRYEYLDEEIIVMIRETLNEK